MVFLGIPNERFGLSNNSVFTIEPRNTFSGTRTFVSSINSVLVIGSGPIVIGQACEFDYSGTQACRVLRDEGVRVILINSNPATIMTDPEFADATYVEPITPEAIEQILIKERPDAVLATCCSPCPRSRRPSIS